MTGPLRSASSQVARLAFSRHPATVAERSGADDDRHYFAYAPNTGAVFAVGQGTGQPPAELNYVKLMPDYSAEMPLWGMPWKDLNLDPALIDRLRAWQRQFDDHFHYERGWDDADIATAWRFEREVLADALRDSVGPSIEVRADPWPE